MRMRKLLQVVCLTVFLIFSSVLYAQQTQSSINFKDVILLILA
jgi:hypothetical protein